MENAHKEAGELEACAELPDQLDQQVTADEEPTVHTSHFTHSQPATTGGMGQVPSRGSLQTHTPCGPTYPNKLARDITTVDLNTAKCHNTCLLAKQGLLCLNSANVTTQDRLSAQDHPQPQGTQHLVPADCQSGLQKLQLRVYYNESTADDRTGNKGGRFQLQNLTSTRSLQYVGLQRTQRCLHRDC